MNYLFPHRFKKLGWFVFIPTLFISIFFVIYEKEYEMFDLVVPALFSDQLFGKSDLFSMVKNNVFDEILSFLLITSGLLLAFSKEKIEDEMVQKIRLESLVWATYANYIVLLCCILFIYGSPFFTVMIYNMFTLLLFFVIRFNWMIYKTSKISEDEK
ncbi:hypothetical protein [Flavobacterium sp.]|uniref:hypothetical protein n=2 Tax=unclassified Flavobacterium TaxID=196869 RepID=UPI002D1FA595|nr:hypothetical protein [Flavobacterium sp.]